MKMEKAYLAGGCFWGMEDLIRKIPGVLTTEVGYMGGESENPKYAQVKTGTTFHAEAVEVSFDPGVLSYRDLLKKFFQMHDPTTLNSQGNDIGTQYRSAIFPANNEQKEVAKALIEKLNALKVFASPVATTIEPLAQFWPAEDYHQDYLIENPNGYTCHFYRKIDLSKI